MKYHLTMDNAWNECLKTWNVVTRYLCMHPSCHCYGTYLSGLPTAGLSADDRDLGRPDQLQQLMLSLPGRKLLSEFLPAKSNQGIQSLETANIVIIFDGKFMFPTANSPTPWVSTSFVPRPFSCIISGKGRGRPGDEARMRPWGRG